jgi:phosphatidylserine/phosphatidylglycerophosphate/cardiolipin synthase-like enzyme
MARCEYNHTLFRGVLNLHQVHMTIAGPSVLDISQHYIERWNEVKKRKVSLIYLSLSSMLTSHLVPS